MEKKQEVPGTSFFAQNIKRLFPLRRAFDVIEGKRISLNNIIKILQEQLVLLDEREEFFRFLKSLHTAHRPSPRDTIYVRYFLLDRNGKPIKEKLTQLLSIMIQETKCDNCGKNSAINVLCEEGISYLGGREDDCKKFEQNSTVKKVCFFCKRIF